MPAQTSNPTSQLPAPRSFEGVSDRLAVARAADERWRGDRTKEGGNWRPTTPVPRSSQGCEPPLRQSVDLESNAQGVPQRPGGAML